MQESQESEEADSEIEFLVSFVFGIILGIRAAACVCVFLCGLIRWCSSTESKQDVVRCVGTNLSVYLQTLRTKTEISILLLTKFYKSIWKLKI